jgi:hypothetical protein
MDESAEHKAKFDAVLRRMATMKPMTAKQVSEKIRAEKAKKSVRKMDKIAAPQPQTGDWG